MQGTDQQRLRTGVSLCGGWTTIGAEIQRRLAAQAGQGQSVLNVVYILFCQRHIDLKKHSVEEMYHFLFFQDVDSEEFWENLVQDSDPSRKPRKQLDYSDIIPQIKSKITTFQAQVLRSTVLSERLKKISP